MSDPLPPPSDEDKTVPAEPPLEQSGDFETHPEQFRRDGWDYRQVARKGLVVVCKQSKGGRVFAYEVAILRQSPARMLGGKMYPPRETYPSPEEWGRHGFTYSGPTGLDLALAKFRSLLS